MKDSEVELMIDGVAGLIHSFLSTPSAVAA
jgi:hypothetical protein